MVIEEQKDTLESTESSLEKQEENIQDVTAVESELEECAENTSDISGIEESSENQQGISALEQEEGSVYNAEDEIKENADQNAEVPVIENSETQVEAPKDESSKKPQNPNAKWYILQAYAGYEGRVEQTINEKLKIEGLEHLVDEIFIPSEDIVRTKDGQKRKVNQKYFPGYVLVRMELTPELWHLLMEINRVSGFIGGTQKKPLPLDDTELEKIRSQISEGSQQKATEDEFLIGQKVTITEGSFGNFSGTIDEINQDEYEATALMYRMIEKYSAQEAPVLFFDQILSKNRIFKKSSIGNLFGKWDLEAMALGIVPTNSSRENYKLAIKKIEQHIDENGKWPRIKPIVIEARKAPCKAKAATGDILSRSLPTVYITFLE